VAFSMFSFERDLHARDHQELISKIWKCYRIPKAVCMDS
jgi:hypothetical protein